MKLSYLVTCHDETTTLDNLLSRLNSFLSNNDDEVVIVTDNPTKETSEILNKWASNNTKICYYVHNLNNNYSEHKNWGALKCKGDYIFQIDGDELPTEFLLDNLKDIIKSNPNIEVFWVSRINDFRGVKPEHALQWGWRLSTSTSYQRPVVNWPDPQARIFKNIPEKIKWVGRLHERIDGNDNFSYLPFDEDLALYHDKTIEKQIETNLRYNKDFSEKENKGFSLPK